MLKNRLVRLALIMVSLAAVVLAAYLPSVSSPLMLDDLAIVRDNPLLENVQLNIYFTHNYWGAANKTGGLYRPLTLTVLSLIKYFSGNEPLLYRLANIIIHILTTLVLFRLVFLLMRREQKDSLVIPYLAALIFAIHPVHVEVINFAVGLGDGLSTLFFMASFLFYVEARTDGKIHKPFFLVSWICFFAALLTKESAASLPIVLAAYELIFRRGISRWKKTLTNVAPYVLFVAAYIALRLFVLGYIGPRGGSQVFYGISTPERLLVMAGVLTRYLRLLFIPYPLRAIYNINQTGMTIFSALGTIILLATPALMIAFRFKPKVVFFGICWFFLTLLPVSNIIPIGAVMAERFLYLPSAGFCIAVAYLLSGPGYSVSSDKKLLKLTTAIYIILFFILIIIRGQDWRSELRFWSREVVLNPNSAVAHNNLGRANNLNGYFDRALNEYELSSRLNPYIPDPLINLGIMSFKRGQYKEAEDFLKRSIPLDPQGYEAYLVLAKIYLAQGRADEAKRFFSRTHELGYRSDETYHLMAVALMAMNESAAAEEAMKKSLSIKPGSPETRFMLGNLYLDQMRYEEAVLAYLLVLKNSPEHVRAMNNLGIALWLDGEFDRAEEIFKSLLTLNPDSPKVYFNLGRIAEEKGNYSQAASYYRMTLKIDPRWDMAREGLDRVGAVSDF